jgi:hypothetical protein
MVDKVTAAPPTPDPTDVWGGDLNALLLALRGAVNGLIDIVSAIGAAGFVTYDNGWPAGTSTSAQLVFLSAGTPGVGDPGLYGADGSVWIGTAA